MPDTNQREGTHACRRLKAAVMRASLVAMASLVLGLNTASAQSSVTVFKGRPTVKVSEGGVERTPEQIPRDRGINLECVISQIGTSYYWASRENVELVRIDTSGAFITFLAVNGAGYVKVVKPEWKALAALAGPTEEHFDYVEHLVLGLRSVTYYGTRPPVQQKGE